MYIQHSTGEEELYDLATDPYELDSLGSDPGYTALRSQLATRLDQYRNCAGATCP